MYRGFERKVPESSDANIDQPESWMIDHQVAAALCAIIGG